MKKILEMILKRIRKNAERCAGLASDKGIFERQVPDSLKEAAGKSKC